MSVERRYRVLGEKSSDDSILLHIVDMECAEGMLDGDYALSGLNSNESLVKSRQCERSEIGASAEKEDVELYFMSRKDYGIPSTVEDKSMGYSTFVYNKGYTDCTLSLSLKKVEGTSLASHIYNVKECKSTNNLRNICRTRLREYNGPYRYFTLLTISSKGRTLPSSVKKRKIREDPS